MAAITGFNFQLQSGDLSVSTGGTQAYPDRLVVGDIAGVNVSDPDLSDLSGITVNYHWWVDGTDRGTGATLAVGAGDVGKDVFVTVSFTHQLTDGSGNVTGTDTEKGVFHFGVVDQTPTAFDDVLSPALGVSHSTTSVNVLGNDTDPGGDSLVVTNFSLGALSVAHTTAYGDVTLYANGQLDVHIDTSDPDFIALAAGDSFTFTYDYSITDGYGLHSGAEIRIAVAGQNDAPVVTFPEGLSATDAAGHNLVTGDLLFHDPDAGDSASVHGIGGSTAAISHTFDGTYGKLHMQADGHFAYTVDLSNTYLLSLASTQHVTEHIHYSVSDGSANVTGTFDIVINAPSGTSPTSGTGTVFLYNDTGYLNDASNSSVAATSNLIGNVLANDSPGGSLHVSGINGQSISPSGQETIGGAYGTLHMHGDGGYSFEVNQTAVDALTSGFHTTLDYTLNVTDNLGGGGIEHLYIQVDGAADGKTGTTPSLSELVDDIGSIADLQAHSTFSTSNLAGNVLANDSSSSPLHVVSVSGHDASPTLYSPPAIVGGLYGTLYMHADGAYNFNYHESVINALTAGFHTTLDFAVNVSDGGASGIEHLYIQIDGANDVPFDNGSSLSGSAYASSITAENTTGTSGFVNFADPEGKSVHLTFSGHTFASASSEFTAYTEWGTFHMWGSGGWTFTLDSSASNLTGLGYNPVEVHFEVGVSDGSGNSTLADIVIDLYGSNDGPTAVNDSAVVPSISGAYELQGNLLDNDFDPDIADELHVVGVYRNDSGSSFAANFDGNVTGSDSGPLSTLHNAFGTLTVWSDGHYTLDVDPSSTAYLDLGAGETAQLHFAYSISDGHEAYSTADFTVTLTGLDEGVVGFDSTVNFTEDNGHYTTSNYVSYTNPDSQVGDLHVVGAAAPTPSGGYAWDNTPRHVAGTDWYTITNDWGSLQISASGSYSFTLDNNSALVQALGPGETQTVQFEYQVSDGLGNTDIANINIVVHGDNDPPHAVADFYTVYEGGITASGACIGGSDLYVNPLSNDQDIDHNPDFHVVLFNRSSPSTVFYTDYGSVQMTYSGELEYHLNQGAIDSLAVGQQVTVDFNYKMADSSSAASKGNISIVIVGENDAPTVYGNITDTSLFEDSVSGVSGSFYLHDVDNGDVALVHSVNGVTAVTSTHSIEGSTDWISVQGDYGTLHMSLDGYFHFDLNAGAQELAQGEVTCESFTFTVSDGHGGHAMSSLHFQIEGANDAPVAADFNFSVTQSACASTDVVGHVSDVDHGAEIMIAGFTGGSLSTWIDTAYGSVWLSASGDLKFDADTAALAHLGVGEHVTLSYSYTAITSHSSTDTGVVSIVINGVNDTPTASSDVNSITEDSSSVSGNVIANDHDTDINDVLIVVGATGHAATLDGDFGYLTIAANGDYHYYLTASSVNALADGSTTMEHFHLTVSDQHGGIVGESLTITITGENDAPVAGPLSLTVHESGISYSATSFSLDLLSNATDPDNGQTATLKVEGIASTTDGTYGSSIDTSLGSATVDGSGHLHFHVHESFVDHLAAGATAHVTIGYEIADASCSKDFGAVTITVFGVNDAPTASTVNATMTEDTPTVTGGLLVNAHDVDDGDTSFTLIGIDGSNGAHISGSHGWISFTSGGQFDYHLDMASVQSLTALQSTFDTFTYTVSDGHGGVGTAQLQIEIDGQNDNPLAGADAASITEAVDFSGVTTVSSNVLGNDSVGGVSQSKLAVSLDGIAITTESAATATGNYGHLHLSASGGYTYALSNDNAAVDALRPGDVLLDVFNYKVSDGLGHFATADITITINGANDSPVATATATGSAYEAGVSSTGANASGDLLSVARDPDNSISELSVHSVSGMLVGTNTVVTGEYGHLHVTTGGGYTYDVSDVNVSVDALQSGDTLHDVFMYRVQDSSGAWVSNTLDITINGHDDAPSVQDAIASAGEAGSATGGYSATGNVLTCSHTFDAEGDSLAVVSVDGHALGAAVAGAFGSISVTASGDFQYNVNEAAADSLAGGATATDTFTVNVSDGHGGYDLANIVITINGANDAPVAGDYSNSITEQGTVTHATFVTGQVMGLDTDPEGDTLSVVSLDTGFPVHNGLLSEHGDFGLLTMTAASGHYKFVLDQSNATIESLNSGNWVTDTFHYVVSDGNGGYDTADLKFTIYGENDAATFSGTLTGSVTEAGGIANSMTNIPSATGYVTVSDVDNYASLQSASGTASYGTFQVTADGWYYNVDNSIGAVEALNTGDTLTDSFNVTAIDGTVQGITITIHGANDAASIGGTLTGNATEAGGVGNATAGADASGAATASDVDNTDNVFQPVGTGAASDSGYGTWSITSGGAWTYSVDDSNSAVQALNAGDTLTDTFTINSIDGTPQTVTVTIHGANDAASFTGSFTGSVMEAGGIANSISNTASATGSISVTDVDSAQSLQVASGAAAYGTYHVNASGWTYDVDEANLSVQALNTGDTLTDSFNVAAADGTLHGVTITINGANDAAVIGGALAGNANEAGGLNNAIPGTTANGTATASDVDNTANTFQAVGNGAPSDSGYGTWSITSGGAWTYTVDDSNAAVQALNSGDTLTDTFTINSVDGTPQTVTVTIHGANDAATFSAAFTGSVVEAGGVANAIGNTPSATGMVSVTDIDNLQLLQVASGAAAYGTYHVNATGWTYDVDNANLSVQALNTGDTLTDSFNVAAVDGTLHGVTITIHGANDAAVIGGTLTGSATEAGGVGNATPGTTASGTATDTDVDNTANTFQVESGAGSSGYGNWSITSGGAWTYTVADNNAAVQALNVGGTLTDSFTIHSIDGTSKVVSVIINGANDAALIGGASSNSAVEAGGVANGTAGSNATGTATSTDVDNTANAFQASGGTGTNGYGTWTVSASGAWNYSIDNNNAAVQALNVGGTLTDTFTILSQDGTAQLITVTINGANDAAIIGGALTGSASEAGGVANGTPGTAASGTATATDVDNTANTFLVGSGSGVHNYGNFSVASDGSWTYTVNEGNAAVQALNVGGTLTDSFTIQSQDGTSKTVNVTINGANDAALIRGALAGFANEARGVNNGIAGTSATGTATSVDVDDTANVFQTVAAGAASDNGYGTWGITAGGTWTYVVNDSNAAVEAMNTGDTLTDTFTIHSQDGTAQVVTITLRGGNDAAVIGGALTGSATEAGGVANGTPGLSAGGTATDTDVDNTANTFVAASGTGASSYGTWSIDTAGAWVYTVNDSNATVQALNVGGTLTDSFTIQSQDGTSKTVNVTINGANDAALIRGALAGFANEARGVGNAIAGSAATGTATSTDVDNTANVFQAVTAGAASDNGYGTWGVTAGGTWTYTADDTNAAVEALNSGDTLIDTFTIHSQDGTAQQVIVTIRGGNDSAVIGGALTGNATEAGGIANGTAGSGASGTATDTDVDNTANTFQVESGAGSAGYGTWSIDAAGAWTYTVDDSNASVQALNVGGKLVDTFTIHSADGTAKVVKVTINGANDAATIAGTASGAVTEAGGANNATPNTPAASGTLTSTDVDNTAAFQSVLVATASANGYGTFTVNAAGHWVYTLDNSNAAVDALAQGATLGDSFTVQSIDGTSQTVTITIHGANDNPIANGDAVVAVEAGVSPGTAPIGNLLTNDTDVDNAHVLSVANVELSTPTADIDGIYGVLHVTSSGAFTYTLNDSDPIVDSLAAGDSATDTFNYVVQDDHGGTSTAQLVVHIDGANDAPTTVADTAAATEGGVVAGSPATGNVLTNDADPDHNATLHTVGATTVGQYGTLVMGSNGQYTYTVDDANASVNAMAAGETLTDTLTYTVVDDHGATGVGSVTITINGADDAPTAVNDTGTAGETGTAVQGFNATGNVLTNDTDPDHNAARSVTKVNNSAANVSGTVFGAYGQLVLNASGSYSYVVNDALAAVNSLGPNQSLHDFFSYTVSDGLGGTSTAQLDITIQGANDAPTGVVTINGNALVGNTLTATNTLSDPEGIGTLHYQWQSNGFNISGANGTSFVVTSLEAGTVIGVVVSYVDGGGTAESATGVVTAIPGQLFSGTRAANLITGTAGSDTIDGGAGNDTMIGGAGNDTYYVDVAKDVVVENANEGNDTIISSVSWVLGANVENLTLAGVAASATGNDLDNVIIGNRGNNTIMGLGGADTLTGGLGSDTFVFNSVNDSSPSAYDTITDFNAAQRDKIDLRKIDAREGTATNDSFRFIGTAEFDPNANNTGLLRFDPVTHMLEGSTNADASVEIRILLIGVDHIGKDAGGINAASFLL